MTRGTRLTAEWQPDAPCWNFASSLGFDASQIESIADHFRDYWVAVPGQRGLKLDWAATWRNWVRREAERKRPRGGGPSIFDIQSDLER